MPDINVQHLMAVLLIDGTLSFAATHDVERMQDSAVLALRRKITPDR
jgi:2-methylcitrate dehydratase PrpD